MNNFNIVVHELWKGYYLVNFVNLDNIDKKDVKIELAYMYGSQLKNLLP